MKEKDMAGKKSIFDKVKKGAGKAQKVIKKGRIIQAIDQNADGKFDFQDVSVIAETIGDAAKKGTNAVKKEVEAQGRALELKTLRPIFPVTLSQDDFFMPKFIRIIDRDKKYAESKVCEGSIGYFTDQKGLRIVNVFKDSVNYFNLEVFPDLGYEVYYVDPTNPNTYIALDEYFVYLKSVRINELQLIAQALGAKHFRVTYKEEQTSFSNTKKKVHAKAPAANIDASLDEKEKKYSMVEIAAEMDFPGHAPEKPVLRYMQRDPNILTLVEMRMNPSSPVLNHHYMLNLSCSNGITQNDAVKIDAVLKGMKYSGNVTVSSEVRNEARRYFEYEVNF